MASISIPTIMTIKSNVTIELSDKDLNTLKSGSVPPDLNKAIAELQNELEERLEGMTLEGDDTIVDHDEVVSVEVEFKEDEIGEAEG
jgi:hypothetical protein